MKIHSIIALIALPCMGQGFAPTAHAASVSDGKKLDVCARNGNADDDACKGKVTAIESMDTSILKTNALTPFNISLTPCSRRKQRPTAHASLAPQKHARAPSPTALDVAKGGALSMSVS